MKDDALIERFLEREEEEGFEMLVRKYQNRVVNIAYSLIGQAYDADDIAQEVFIKVYKNLNSFDRKAKFSTWLYRITVNTTYNYIKKKKRYIPMDYLDRPDVFEEAPSEKPEGDEKQALIKKAIERLPLKYRSVIVLKEIESFSYKDIAKTLNCRIGTVESRLFRARRMLKKILSPVIKEKEDEMR